MFDNLFTLWSDQPGLSLAIWFAVLILIMYLGRASSHQLIRSTGRALSTSLRLASRSIAQLRAHLVQRNKEVVLNAGRETMEQTIEREFARVHAIVAKDLSAYPDLHRQISDTVDALQKEYRDSAYAAPLPPAWLDAVEAVAAIPRTADSPVGAILENIQKTIESAHKETLQAFRKSSLERHRQLSKTQPLWSSLGKSLDKVSANINVLNERSETIDKQMQNYQKIRTGEDSAARLLTASSLAQFFISGLVLVIAILGGLINFQLIALPMSEMVGGTSYIGAMRTSDIAALVIILIEIAMGLFLMESLRITHLFPIIGSMDDKMRKRMLVITLSILAILAGIEASLAYMRDLLALDREALTQSLAGGAVVVEAQFRWIPSLGQMVMGFILPFALAFVAIPLESFVHSLRTVLGLALVTVLHALVVALRLLGNVVGHCCKILISLYDLIIMIPLSAEQFLSGRKNEKHVAKQDAARPLVKETLK